MMEDIIGKTLNLVPYDEDAPDELAIVPNQDAELDIEYAREAMFDVSNTATEAIKDLVNIAQQSQHPKAYEALNNAIKTKLDIANSIAGLQLTKQKILQNNAKKSAGEDGKVVNNNLFVGTTADLLRMLNGKLADE